MGRWLRLCSLCGLGVLVGRQASTRQLERPASEFPHGFTRVKALRALSSGRVIVVDSRDRRLLILDWERGTVSDVARAGSGPLEIRTPIELLDMPGDTTWVSDVVNWRWLVESGQPSHL